MRTRLQNYLITGLLVIMPLAVTYVVLRWLFNTLDNMLQPVLFPFFGHIPGLGVLTGVAIILVAGGAGRGRAFTPSVLSPPARERGPRPKWVTSAFQCLSTPPAGSP